MAGESDAEADTTRQRVAAEKVGGSDPGCGVTEAQRAHGSWRSWVCVHRHSLPPFLQDNEFLIDQHRPQLPSWLQCLMSAFRIHTETWNIWTHLIGCIGCILLTPYYLFVLASGWQHAATFSAFFAGAIFCLAASTIFHLFGCHSEHVNKQLAKMDYCGVIGLIVSSFYPWLYFGFYCDVTTQWVYAVAVTLLGVLCVTVVLKDRFSQPQFRPLRAGLFLGLGLTGLVPGLHYMWTDGLTYGHWLLTMGGLYVAGGLIYAARIPERMFPGKCDIWGQSHQILHLCVMGGVVTCYGGVSQLAAHRLQTGDEMCNALLDG